MTVSDIPGYSRPSILSISKESRNIIGALTYLHAEHSLNCVTLCSTALQLLFEHLFNGLGARIIIYPSPYRRVYPQALRHPKIILSFLRTVESIRVIVQIACE